MRIWYTVAAQAGHCSEPDHLLTKGGDFIEILPVLLSKEFRDFLGEFFRENSLVPFFLEKVSLYQEIVKEEECPAIPSPLMWRATTKVHHLTLKALVKFVRSVISATGM
jgi:hypothetical protein